MRRLGAARELWCKPLVRGIFCQNAPLSKRGAGLRGETTAQQKRRPSRQARHGACLRRPRVRVSGGDHGVAEAPTDAAAETAVLGSCKPFEKGLAKTLCYAISYFCFVQFYFFAHYSNNIYFYPKISSA